MGRDKFPVQSLGTLYGRIKAARVLLVGAGGIGCELLKNLSLTGFGEIHVVDLDTIDLSNLNRQFLFRHEHIKKSKALVARSSATAFNPHVKIQAYHADIKDPQFDVEWIKTFAVVFNALDNLEARRHVNKICLAAKTPLIESGTTGFNGQVQPIKKDITECYDCSVKETPKTFPVCTIRSTPSQPIHCIVWAKSYLFAELFGNSEDDALEPDEAAGIENRAEVASLMEEARALKALREAMTKEEFPELVFRTVFEKDIIKLKSMKEMWKSRKAPEILDFTEVSQESSAVDKNIASQDQRVWTLAENFAIFIASLKRLSDRLVKPITNTNEPFDDYSPTITFDKDDAEIINFITASSNLRSVVFGIESKSRFDVKQMAGNIIPAIATTNAMIASLCVLQAFKVLREEYAKAKMIYLTKSIDRAITSETLRAPRHDCPICGVIYANLVLDLSRAKLEDFVHDILKVNFGYNEFSVTSDAGLLYDPDFNDNLKKKFSDLEITTTTFLTVIDEEDDDPHVNVLFSITNKSLPLGSAPIITPESLKIHKKSEVKQPVKANKQIESQSNGVTGKRKRESVDTSASDGFVRKQDKVAKLTGPTSQITLEDSADGSIVVDD